MPKISKTSKAKKVVAKKKTTTTKTKTTPVKKLVIKKPAVKKKIKAAPKKANQVVVDIISDNEEQFSNYQEAPTAQSVAPVFSSWPNFDNKAKAEDILNEVDEEDEDIQNIPANDVEEYDKQKKFFSDWATQNTPKEGDDKPSLAPNRKSIGLYRRQAVFYLAATMILLVAVAYFFFVKLTISIAPQGENINDSISFSVIGSDASSTASSTDATEITNKTIDGQLQITEIEAEKPFQTTSENVSGAVSEVGGVVTLSNKSARNQPLVVKTRLLSPDGKQFRLKESVVVPAGGSVNANVHADTPGTDMAIDTTVRFTIPGLGTQDKIYAENSEPLTYQTEVKRIVKQSDLDAAKKDINEVLDLQAKNDLQSGSSDQKIVYGDAEDDIVTEFDAKVGDEKPNFTVKAKKKIVVVTFSKAKAVELAKARLSLVVSDDKQISNFNPEQIKYDLVNYDVNTKVAEIKASYSALMSLKSDSSLIDRKKLVGLNEQQISQYLNSFPEVKDYKLEFWPSFIKTAPNLPDRINIQIGN